MRLRHRRIYFSIMVCVFLVAAPTLIGYGMGWRYRADSRRLEKISALSVTSTPRGATVYIDGTMQLQQTPLSINNLHADDYTVRLEKEGYFTWEKKIRTYPDRVTRMSNAYLVPTPSFESNLIATPLQSMFVSPSGNTILTLNQTTLTSYRVDGTEQWSYTASAPSARIHWSADENYLLITFADAAMPPVILDTAGGTTVAIPTPSDEFVREYAWSRDERTLLYARTDRTTYQIHVLNAILTELVEPPVQEYAGTSLRIIRAAVTATWETNDGQTIATLPIPLSHAIDVEAHGHALFVLDTTAQSLYTIDVSTRQSKPLAHRVFMFQWGSQRKELLYATSTELWLYNPELASETLVLRTSQNIMHAQLVVSDQYIGYVSAPQELIMFEINDLPRNTYTVPTGTIMGLRTLPDNKTTLLGVEEAVYQLILE